MLLIEALSFKLSLDFFTYLSKNRITSNSIKLSFFDRNVTEFTSFTNTDTLKEYYDLNYSIVDKCKLGSLVGIISFKGLSDLYDFTTDYRAIDVIGSFKLKSGLSYDRERNVARKMMKERQFKFLEKSINKYVAFFNEIKNIYITGVYSPCYAIPGWSQNTYYLNSLKENIVNTKNNLKFPYDDATFESEPPE